MVQLYFAGKIVRRIKPNQVIEQKTRVESKERNSNDSRSIDDNGFLVSKETASVGG